MKTNCLYYRFICLFFLVSLLACNKKDAPVPDIAPVSKESALKALTQLSGGDAAVPLSWYQLELKLIKESTGFSPPVAARAIAYTGITLHEVVVVGKRGPALSGQLNGLQYVPTPERWKKYNWAIAANSAMAQIIRNLFPNASVENLNLITQLENDNLQALSDSCTQDVTTRSINYGKLVASAIYQWSTTDGGKDGYLNNFPTDYIPPVGPGLWIPTPPAFQRAMLPYWGNNRPMVKPSTPDLADIQPPAYSTDTTSTFYQAAHFVYQTRKTLTPEQTLIAKYWADGGGTFTPPGHLLAITAQLVNDQQLDLEAAATLFAQVGIGLNDAGILCWKYKYQYNLLRPITYIRANIDSSWAPLIGTPPFPSYTSGHATFTGATGYILAAYFGNSFSFTDNQKVPEGFVPRSFNNFLDMINEAAISRVYGGIHYQFDSETGKQTGKDIAGRVLALKY
ncbi:PAP2 superfamily protein [Chitinophaga niastensis]|uniref:PAP2 superfamily protein n=1 Tax=Chitinophaga niastensis TaxID=536980 RepID=A0A2P8HCJ0_CHINA|nr:vanadium-dependent haloperoxidase [Chitinophaga niastensis]PSL43939.1 PAP2 superfamily protein [Chitinophaga niastensis]